MSEPRQIPQSFDPPEFDQWAEGYDEDTALASGFPFEGYPEVLDEIIRCAHINEPVRVLDIGCGTGNLALRFHTLGCSVHGTDFSHEMLKKAHLKVDGHQTGIAFSHWDLRDPWPGSLPAQFDRIVSAYTIHHFTLERKIALLQDFGEHLAPGGKIVIGDIAFETREDLDRAREHFGSAWDEEYYWVASEVIPALALAGWHADYRQVSSCAGVYCLSRAD